MSSEFIVVLALVVLAAVGIIYLERHSRKNSRHEDTRPQSKDRE